MKPNPTSTIVSVGESTLESGNYLALVTMENGDSGYAWSAKESRIEEIRKLVGQEVPYKIIQSRDKTKDMMSIYNTPDAPTPPVTAPVSAAFANTAAGKRDQWLKDQNNYFAAKQLLDRCWHFDKIVQPLYTELLKHLLSKIETGTEFEVTEEVVNAMMKKAKELYDQDERGMGGTE